MARRTRPSVCSDTDTPWSSNRIAPFTCDGLQPGTRAPHVCEPAGRRLSTLDLFTQDDVLLSADAHWDTAGKGADGIVRAYQAGRDVVFPADALFAQVFGVTPEGATLIRPDGLVCWRAVELPVDPAATLDAVLR